MESSVDPLEVKVSIVGRNQEAYEVLYIFMAMGKKIKLTSVIWKNSEKEGLLGGREAHSVRGLSLIFQPSWRGGGVESRFVEQYAL